MKRIIIFLFTVLFLFSACVDPTRYVNYEIENTTDYDVTVIDKAYLEQPEYLIKANSSITLSHPSTGKFEIKNNSLPIEIDNSYSYSKIKELNYFELTVYNNASKEFVLKINNSTFPPDSYNIFQPETNLKIYTNKLAIELYLNNLKYDNYLLKDNCLVIY